MRLYAIPAIAFLSACTLQPRYQRPAAPVAAHYPAFGAAKPEETGWRDFFADPRLQALIDIALRNNRDLRIAALKVEQTRAQYQIARAAFIPALQVRSGAERSRIPESVPPAGQSMTRGQYSIGAGIAWEIDFFGKLHSLKDAALAAYLSTAHACRAAEIALVAALESERLVKLRVDAGVASALDLTDAEGAAARARTNEQNQLRARAQAENALVLLLGQPLPDNLPPAAALDPQGILADLPAGVPSDLLTRRPDIMAAEEMLRAANAQIGAARAAFFPSISLT